MPLFAKSRDQISAWYLRRFLRRTEPNFVFGQRRLYIVPLWPGVGLFAGFLIMLFASINYGMNTGFMFSFMVVGYGIVAALMTNLNLYGLRLTAPGRSPAVFCGQPAVFTVTLSNSRNARRYAIAVGRDDRFDIVDPVYLNLPGRSTASASIEMPAQRRGWMVCPLIQVETAYPFGLFRVWGYWNPGVKVLVYPSPEAGAPALFSSQGEGGQNHAEGAHASQDIAGVRTYRPGDQRKQLAWRQIAKTDGFTTGHLFTKDHDGESAVQLRFHYDDLPASLTTEQRLSRLAAWSLAAHAAGAAYCVELPRDSSGMGSGERHLAHCLAMLALYETTENRA